MTFTFDKQSRSVWYEHRYFSIYADRRGIRLIGDTPIITTQEDYEQFTRVIGWAWRQHQSLRDSGIALSQEDLEIELIS